MSLIDGVLGDLRKIIEGNGNVPDEVKDKIILTTIYAILTEVRDLKKGLERNPFFVVGDLIVKHPRLALTVTVILAIVTNIVFVAEIRTPILKLLGVDIP